MGEFPPAQVFLFDRLLGWYGTIVSIVSDLRISPKGILVWQKGQQENLSGVESQDSAANSAKDIRAKERPPKMVLLLSVEEGTSTVCVASDDSLGSGEFKRLPQPKRRM